jgi:arsenite-transporting ATPase
MMPALLERLGARFVFVVGKGGVGKTTTAAALALSHAPTASTLLISTDPAHSLGDVFEQDLSGASPARSACHPALMLEEFDARAYALRFNAWAEPHLLELVERGTYLDSDDARALVKLTLPGVDEIMGALRLAETAGESWQKIVIDTAPTGHALRLLDAARQIESFVQALRPMAEKATVVASRLLRADVHLESEKFLDDLERRATAFAEDVLKRADFVVVTRVGELVRAETERLKDELAVRGLRVAAVVCTGGGCADAEALNAPARPNVRGCDALLHWGHPTTGPVPAAPHARKTAAPAAAWLDQVDASLALFAGKGGVGKSTCAAAAAIHLSATRSVALYSTDPAGSLPDVLGTAVPAGGAWVTPTLFVKQLDGLTAFARLRDEYQADVAEVFQRLGIDQSAALDRRVVDSLFDMAPPGMDELVALVELLEAPADTLLVLDSAPTGHFLRLIEMPELALEWVRAAMRLIIKYHVATLDDAARAVLALARQLKELRTKLLDPDRTAIFVVTLNEPVVRLETERLVQTLTGAGMPLRAVIFNRADAGTPIPGSPPARVYAPLWREPPIGLAALRKFLSQWTISA